MRSSCDDDAWARSFAIEVTVGVLGNGSLWLVDAAGVEVESDVMAGSAL